MTEREAAIVSAFTGVALGDFNITHRYIEELLERPVFIHELASNELAARIKERARTDFCNLKVTP